MGKSRYSKTKAAGMLCGMSRYKDYSFKQAGVPGNAGNVPNRQMRRLNRTDARKKRGQDDVAVVKVQDFVKK